VSDGAARGLAISFESCLGSTNGQLIYSGKLAELAVFDAVQSARNIWLLSTYTSIASPLVPRVYFKFGETSGSTITSSVGTAKATFPGGVSFSIDVSWQQALNGT
jgi:hypothetical protein